MNNGIVFVDKEILHYIKDGIQIQVYNLKIN